jgi:hypothetical protein
MRRKALLVSARAGVSGPPVILDNGEWEVEEHPSVKLHWESNSWQRVDGKLRIRGRAKVYAAVDSDYDGDGIHLDAVQVA